MYFYGGQHSDIYKTKCDESTCEKELLKNQLMQIFTEINTLKDIHTSIQKLKRVERDFDISKRKLDLLFRQIASKTGLNIVCQCKYLKPGLE